MWYSGRTFEAKRINSMENELKEPVIIMLDNACTEDSIAILWEKVEAAVGYEVFVEDAFLATTESTRCTSLP